MKKNKRPQRQKRNEIRITTKSTAMKKAMIINKRLKRQRDEQRRKARTAKRWSKDVFLFIRVVNSTKYVRHRYVEGRVKVLMKCSSSTNTLTVFVLFFVPQAHAKSKKNQLGQ